MIIGIIGTGPIGATIARKLVASGHKVLLTNSSGGEALAAIASEVGAVPVTKEGAVRGVDAIVVAIPFGNYPKLASLLSEVGGDIPVIDTSNYYPFRDGIIADVVAGKPEGVWVSEQIGRPTVKVWNAVLAETLASRGVPAGAPGRIAIPVAGDDATAKAIAIRLVGETGFDGLDAGRMADSWRQEPGTPAWCTELSLGSLKSALAVANRQRIPKNRETLIKEITAKGRVLSHDELVALNRSVAA